MSKDIIVKDGNLGEAFKEISNKSVLNNMTKTNKTIKGRCVKCNAPFLQHHHIHVTRDGAYHSSCYKKRITKKTKKTWEEEFDWVKEIEKRIKLLKEMCEVLKHEPNEGDDCPHNSKKEVLEELLKSTE